MFEWARARVADQIEILHWLYNLTDEQFLLDLEDTLVSQANDWPRFFSSLDPDETDFRPTHAVNVSQAMKYHPVRFQRTGQEADRVGALNAIQLLREKHGLALGMWSGTETLADQSDTQGVELCSIVEQLLSNASILKVSADAALGDEQERIAFSLLSASMTADLHQHQYYTLPNAISAGQNRVGDLQFADDHGDDLLVSPHAGFHCCCYNLHMGWPKYVQYCWMLTADGGLAAVAHGPSTVSFSAGEASFTITALTEYPFEDDIRYRFESDQPAEFPFLVRVPAWCSRPRVSVNGVPVAVDGPGFLRIERLWSHGDEVVANFECEPALKKNASGSVTVWRGPLAFSLRIEQNRRIVTPQPPGFEEFGLDAGSPWNYAIVTGKSVADLSLERREMPANPWRPETTPLVIRAKGQRLEGWRMAEGHVRMETPAPSKFKDERSDLEDLLLVPCGTQTLRLTAFPVLEAE
ncbi:hypothetical protein GCM10007989_31570 [Devosia pacifica]|uniref:Beta-L-arabinofuranosidase (Glycosyl hydrolase family 127) n=1 Tax=Devosia pacifica TaxID=1335967 RepID=A0A918VXZ8_9HYPH|nr:beta-L-arabinofuranosidase domain-containing protein [Devosia pacifica]GHA33121.1 hypothetical protein GCM10007989_31570 [Devosia pacifica]